MLGVKRVNLNVQNKRSLVRYRKVDGIPGIYIRDYLKASRWWQ